MIKKTITYVNPFTEQQVTEDHYFHLSKSDLLEMEMEEHKATYTDKSGKELAGLQAHMQKMIDAEDAKAVLKEFKAILRRAYGKKVNDRFVKNTETWEEFEGSDAYSELLFSLWTTPDEMSKFVNSLLPGNLEEVAKEVAARAEAEQAKVTQLRSETPEVSTPIHQGPQEVSGVAQTDREREIAQATPESPVKLTEAESKDMLFENLKAGLADGRYKLS